MAEPVQRFTGRSVVGLDLDGVCADYIGGFRPYAAEYLGVEPADLAEPSTYDLVEAGWPFADRADFSAAHRAAVEQGLYRDLPALPGVAEAARALSDAGAHIRIVTHRLFLGGSHRRVVSDTAEWLDRVGIPYMSLCFTGLKDSVGAHVYIEDSPGNIDTLQRYGWPVMVFDQPYNREVEVERITDWESGAEQILRRLRSAGEI